MTADPSFWNSGLLFAGLVVLLGMSGFVAARDSHSRSLASGLLSQGILLSFVVASVYFKNSLELQLGGLIVLGLLIVQAVSIRENDEADGFPNEDRSV